MQPNYILHGGKTGSASSVSARPCGTSESNRLLLTHVSSPSHSSCVLAATAEPHFHAQTSGKRAFNPNCSTDFSNNTLPLFEFVFA